MKARFFSIIAISTLILVAVSIFITFSCAKKTDCVAKVNCIDAHGNAIAGADIRLFANVRTPGNGTVTADLKAAGLTDAEGKAMFTFKLPAIYDIKATVGTNTVASIIKLEEGKTIEKTVVVK